jgi:Mg2+/Co2+ transporter CorC
MDNIIGLLLAKDLIAVLRDAPTDFAVTQVMRPVHVVPGSREVEEVLADFKRLKEHMAVVLDEYGGTAGIVTMEDLLEEIVGEILDEHDDPEDDTEPVAGADVLTPGAMNIGELNERFGLEIPDDEYATIGGYVFGALGRLPVEGDRATRSEPARIIVRAWCALSDDRPPPHDVGAEEQRVDHAPGIRDALPRDVERGAVIG